MICRRLNSWNEMFVEMTSALGRNGDAFEDGPGGHLPGATEATLSVEWGVKGLVQILQQMEGSVELNQAVIAM